MFGWQKGFTLGLLGLAVACGGQAGVEGAGGNSSGGTAGAPASSSGGRSYGFSGGPSSGGAFMGGQTGSGGTIVDPGCPDIEPPPPIVECDPLQPTTSCPVGEGCYPYVDHPFGDTCGTEVFGAICHATGSGTQGSECGEGTPGCGAGFICVLGARSGKRCAKVCLVNRPNTCTDGLVCEDTDIQGYGVCN
jgi:hypothetical protein